MTGDDYVSVSNLAGEQIDDTILCRSTTVASTTRPQRRKTKTSSSVALIKLGDHEVVRHESLAYLDGYADARALGKTGFFMRAEYAPDARERYQDGFKKGLRVHAVLNRLSERMTPRDGG